MLKIIEPFIAAVAAGEVEIYNEFSLQHELGIFLRSILPDQKVQFERNVAHFGFDKRDFVKREIDITAFDMRRQNLHYAVELKFPRNGQHPEQMFSFCKDILFAEQLKCSGFEKAYVVIFVEDHLFYSGSGNGIYGYFRAGHPLQGTITKPTGAKNEEINIGGHYEVKWHPVKGDLKYTVIEAM